MKRRFLRVFCAELRDTSRAGGHPFPLSAAALSRAPSIPRLSEMRLLASHLSTARWLGKDSTTIDTFNGFFSDERSCTYLIRRGM
ncbi:hypothetical protein TNCV_728151 [Trichonephila clavipes]|nr:hypothetical protein TNCV_728151 [Trichonephila clavipes]